MAGRESHAAVPASGRPFGRPTALRLAPLALHHLLDVPTHRQLALRKDADRELAPVRLGGGTARGGGGEICSPEAHQTVPFALDSP